MERLLWLDCEMTGLDPERHRLIEVGALVTDLHFQPRESYSAVIWQPPEALAAMDDWCRKTHGESGLTARVGQGRPEREVEAELVALVGRHFGEARAVLAGNSIAQDRRFVDRWLPVLAARLHYRMLDVTAWKLLMEHRFGVKLEKRKHHRVLDDIDESIHELSLYVSLIAAPEQEPSPGPGA
jgi:oligoribonuclease